MFSTTKGLLHTNCFGILDGQGFFVYTFFSHLKVVPDIIVRHSLYVSWMRWYIHEQAVKIISNNYFISVAAFDLRLTMKIPRVYSCISHMLINKGREDGWMDGHYSIPLVLTALLPVIESCGDSPGNARSQDHQRASSVQLAHAALAVLPQHPPASSRAVSLFFQAFLHVSHQRR